MSEGYDTKGNGSLPVTNTVKETVTSSIKGSSDYPKDISARKVYQIKPENWDQVFPYYFMVGKADPKTGQCSASEKNDDFKIFELPINPSSISVSTPFAINVTPTTRGILEEHNGTIFRNISISGTTGITPKNLRQASYAKSSGQGAFAPLSNTIGELNNLKSSINNLVQTATDFSTPASSGVDMSKLSEFGYSKLHALYNYFVAYTEYKKRSTNDAKNARLIFVSRKDNVGYVVTPMSFEWNKSNEKPSLYTYSISLKCWDLAPIGGMQAFNTTTDFLINFSTNSAEIGRVYNTLKSARAVLSTASHTIEAVTEDMSSAYTIVGEALLTVKDTGSLGRTLADFPSLVKNKWNELAADFDNKIQQIQDSIRSGNNDSQVTKNILNSISKLQDSANSTNSVTDVTNASSTVLASDPSAKRQTDQIRMDIQNPFADSSATIDHTDFLDTYDLSSFPLSSDDQMVIDNKTKQLQDYNTNDWNIQSNKLKRVRDVYAYSRTLMDTDYAAMVGFVVPTNITPQPAVSNDFLVLKAYNDAIAAIDAMTATTDSLVISIADPFIRAQQIVGDSGIVIVPARSAFPVPFPHNGTLESLANTYLGSPDRWIDIALLNQLKPPYIDQDGFFRYFSTSGNGNSFTVSDVTNLYLNQEIFISSATRKSERRLIVDIETLGISNYLITVDGDSNLNLFTATQLAKMQAYLPNTVNSDKMIYIPMPGGVAESDLIPSVKSIPATLNLSDHQKMIGTDLRLTDNFDLAINNNSDIELSVSYANALQALRLKLGIELGQLVRHPSFGSGIEVGTKNKYTAGELRNLIEGAILSDPRFAEVSSISVSINGPVTTINVVVKLSNGQGVLPISFQI